MSEFRARVYLIGDKDGGMTIVITDPVMVVHYTKEDMEKAQDEYGEHARAAVVRHLLPQLRGVDVPELKEFGRKLATSDHGELELEAEEGYFRELHYSETIAQHIAEGSGIYDVSFCLAMDADVSKLVIRGRKADPGESIGAYLDQNFTTEPEKRPEDDPRRPKKYDIRGVSADGIEGKPEPWDH